MACAVDARILSHRRDGTVAIIGSYAYANYESGYISEALYISPNTARTHIHNI